MPESLPTAPRRSPVAPDVDVSGRALHLRDVDIGAFLHPKTIALIGASDQSAKPNTAMTRKFAQWSQQNGATFYPVHPERASVLGPNTNLNAFEEFRDDLAGPSIALITQSGHQGRPVFQGQEVGIRLTHWAPTGNEVDLEFADFARHFADQPEVGVIACYIEGFKDGRTLMLAADHAAKLRKPIVMVKVGKTAAGRSMAQSHTGHLTGSDR